MVEIRNIRRKDYKKAIKYSSVGMHFDMYVQNKAALYLYSRYFLFSEMLRATRIYGAYSGGEFLGLLVANIKGEKLCYKSLFNRAYVGLFEWVLRLFYKDSAGEFEDACHDMVASYKGRSNPDGEIVLLAKDPKTSVKGVGKMLIEKLRQDESGKEIYLLTDSGCNFGFYDHIGFTREEERDIILSLDEEIPLKCLLYSVRF